MEMIETMKPLTKKMIDKYKKMGYRKWELRAWSLMRCISVECPCTICRSDEHECEYYVKT